MAGLITQSQYARMRGVSRQAVGARVKEGVIAAHGDRGLIDPDEADVALADAATVAHVESGNGKLGRAAIQAVGQPVDDAPPRMITIHESRAKKAAEDAERSRIAREREEMDLAVKRGELASLAIVEANLIALLTEVRTRLMAVPSTAAPRISGSLTVAEIEAVIRDHIDEALECLTRIDFVADASIGDPGGLANV